MDYTNMHFNWNLPLIRVVKYESHKDNMDNHKDYSNSPRYHKVATL